MSGVAREPVRFNEQDDSRTTIAKLNRLVDELYTKLAVAELRISQTFKLMKDPTAGYALVCDADGKGTWQQVATSAGGSSGQVQFNDAGSFAGDSGLTYNKTSNALTVGGDLNGVNEFDCTTLDVAGNGDIAGTTDLHDTLTMRDNATIVITGTGEFYLKDQTVPITATSEGTQGRIAFDGSHIYYCSATDTWVRAQMNTW